MTGFFYDIRGLFNAKHGGKYMCLLLRELALREANVFAKIFKLTANQKVGLARRKIQVELEFSFDVIISGTARRRRADLALLDKGEPILIIEVKEDDVNNPANQEQLADYMLYLKQLSKDVRFAHVSRYTPNDSDRQQLAKAKRKRIAVQSLRFRTIYEGVQNNKSPLCEMVGEYLEDIGVATYQSIDLAKQSKAISFFLVQTLGFTHKHGLGKLNSQSSITALPNLLTSFFGNLEVLGEWVKNANPSLFAQRFSRRYRPSPLFDIKPLRKAIEKASDKEPMFLPTEKFVKSGTVSFELTGSFTGHKWLAIYLGYYFHIEANSLEKEQPAGLYMFAAIQGSGVKYTEKLSRRFVKFPTEIQAHKALSKLMSGTVEDAMKLEIDRDHRSKLKAFRVPS